MRMDCTGNNKGLIKMDFIDIAKLVELKQDFDNALTAYQNSFKLYNVNVTFDGAIGKTFSRDNVVFGCFRKTYIDYCYDQVMCCIREIEYFGIDMKKERDQVSVMLQNELSPVKEKE